MTIDRQWIDYDGSGQPYPDRQAVECRFDDGSVDVNRADEWDWQSNHSPIIAYRKASRQALTQYRKTGDHDVA